MWWPGTGTGWYEGHNSFGATQTGTQWAMGAGEITAAPKSAATYVLVANTAAWDATVAVTVLFDDGTPAVTRTFGVVATSRFNVAVNGPGSHVPELTNEGFGTVIDSTEPIVVERSVYSNAGDVIWAAGSNATATRLP